MWVLSSGLEKHTLVYHYTSVRVVSSGWETICVRKLFWSIGNYSGNKASRYASLLEVTKQTLEHKPSVRVDFQKMRTAFSESRNFGSIENYSENKASRYASLLEVTKKSISVYLLVSSSKFSKKANSFSESRNFGSIENHSVNKTSRYVLFRFTP